MTAPLETSIPVLLTDGFDGGHVARLVLGVHIGERPTLKHPLDSHVQSEVFTAMRNAWAAAHSIVLHPSEPRNTSATQSSAYIGAWRVEDIATGDRLKVVGDSLSAAAAVGWAQLLRGTIDSATAVKPLVLAGLSGVDGRLVSIGGLSAKLAAFGRARANGSPWAQGFDSIVIADSQQIDPIAIPAGIRLHTARSLDAIQTEIPQSSFASSITSREIEVNSTLIAYLSRNPDQIRGVSSRAFELIIAEVLKRLGFDTNVTPSSKDGGRDILATFDTLFGKLLAVVECKHYAASNKVGLEIVERFLWTVDHHDRASVGIVVTTSNFTAGALARANEFQYKLKLADFDMVREWLIRSGTTNSNATGGIWVPS